LDCGACSYPPCPGTPVCSSNGACSEGVCLCYGPFIGPDCSMDSSRPTIGAVTVTNNSTSIQYPPSLAITTPSTFDNSGKAQSPIAFDIYVKNVIETDQTGSMVKNFIVPVQNFTVGNTTVVLSDKSVVQVINITYPLTGNATLLITLSLYQNAGSANFDSLYANVSQNGMQYSIEVRNWPFEQLQNQLTLVLVGSSSSKPAVTTSAPVAGTNLQWVNLQVNQTSLYAKFLQSGVVDDVGSFVQYSAVNNTDGIMEVHATLPHFWEYAEIGAIYYVTQQQDASSSSEMWYKSVTFIATISAVGGAVLLGAVVLIIVKAKHNRFSTVLKEIEM